MESLPHALFDATADSAAPPEGCGLLVHAGDGRIKGSLVIVDADIGTKTLRHTIAGGAAAIALIGWRKGPDIQRLATLLSVAEAEAGARDGNTRILAITDGIRTHGLAGTSGRLAALVWDHRVLARTLRARRCLTEAGEWTAAFAAARATTLLSAAAAGIPAFDSLGELAAEALETACERSRDDGFFGGLATDRTQVATIRAVYGRRG